ncbi:glycoside hydrolase family 20 protein [uncultured Rikenella sp.]|uniref:glycoside hydrolase family 20 protein n=1 Tax=uncultured Rikenella sp. TaxID=368003 RepID=UPI002616A299|nr:glycoside hydrolase family 20 protein [uncultured Rikenella sp.]
MNPIHRLLGTAIVAGALVSCSSGTVQKADYQVIPLPQQITAVEGADFRLDEGVKILYPEGNEKMQKNAAFLAEYIGQMTGLELPTAAESAADGKGNIVLELGLEAENPEAYRLTVNADGVRIAGASEAGVFYGIQTLRKSLPITVKTGGTVALPAVEVDDRPRFAYRGTHLDVSRHFIGVDSVKRFIDILALHNINRFHWHLTDDQGWRIEIKGRPELTAVGSQRKATVIGHNSGRYDSIPYGGFYTQDEAREIVAYAADRHITVIPEIDLPGHMLAALTAYPELGCTGGPYEVWGQWGVSEDVLCAGNDATLQFIDEVLAEIIDIFPSEYIHVGGDECPKVRWEACPKCQARIRALGLKDDAKHTAEEYLQSFVINHAEKFLNARRRQIIGWDETLEGGLAPNATVMSWRGVEGGIEAARQKHQAIMTPTTYLYFDYYQSKDVENEPIAIGGYVPVEMVYNYEPVSPRLSPEEAKYIIGVQANIWTEYMPNFRQVEYMALPRLAALAEIQWTDPSLKNYERFLARLPQLVRIYDLLGYNYATHVFDVNVSFVPNASEGVLDVAMKAIDGAPIHYTTDGSEPTADSPRYTDTVKIAEPCTLKAVVVRPNGNSRVFTEEIAFNKASMKPIAMLQPINKQYEYAGAGTLVDGLKGNGNYKTGRWIAFWQNDMEAVIDLLRPTEVSRAQIETCVVKGDWVFDARYLGVSVSDDGETFRPVAEADYPVMTAADRDGVYEHALTFEPVTARYVKVVVRPEHGMPAWHPGAGSPAFVFIDEISLN